MSIIHLDCTLRDGGYYNDWDFADDLVQAYLRAMDACGVDYIELGFRFTSNNGYKGPYAYTKDSLIERFERPKRAKIGVMANGAEFAGNANALDVAKQLFNPANESAVSLVRLACHYRELEAVEPVCVWLKEQGYQVGLNLMQIAQRTEHEREDVGRIAARAEIDALYFADSLGSLHSTDVTQIIDQFRQTWSGAIGVHAHDNLGRAVHNTLSALDGGATWVDSTVTGMGRGPGNAQTEYVAIELADRRDETVDFVPLLELIEDYFKPLQQHFQWGENPYYYLSGKLGIHPTYIQTMLSDKRFSVADKLSVIDHLRELGAQSFKADNLLAGRNLGSSEQRDIGAWAPSEEIGGREVLILAAGPSLQRHAAAISEYIQNNNPVVFALNTHPAFASMPVDFHVASHPVRLLADADRYQQLNRPLIAPMSTMTQHAHAALQGVQTRDFGMQVVENKFAFEQRKATVPAPLAMCYALAIAGSAQASRILLAGIDGYAAGDPRNAEMDDLLELFQSVSDAPPVLAVTKTIYNVPAGTIYAL